MLLLKKISLTQFKNYDSRSFEFANRVVAITGRNGTGKTNLIDAVHYLCFTKSYFTGTDAQTVQFSTDGFRIEGIFEKQGEEQKVVDVYRGNGKKEILLNEVSYEKFSSHIGKFTCVMVAPDDVELIIGGSEERRKFLDTMLAQLDADYLQQLISYTKILQQRNSLLKSFAETGKTDWGLLDVIDYQLLHPCSTIFTKRRDFLEAFIPLVQKTYVDIADNNEEVTIQYESQLKQYSFESLIEQYRQKDFALQRTHAGIHKDDLNINLNGQNFKTTASQGQRKSLLFALKLAEFEVLKNKKGFAPLLLLDDIFEKLDNERMNNLLKKVCVENDVQVFITDTHEERIKKSLGMLNVPFQIVHLT
ncbi:MAG TPA: DNA replication and repair protein RecF [Chitinophagaceae bacterium]|nr:DNA replication and repair protein RecF [Chitinophagaceae bacterium]